jgi:transcriptional regulator with XRE-family HTH domain
MDNDLGSGFGGLLRQCREEALLTQEELARARLGLRTIQDLERGVNQTPRPAIARQLAEGLGLAGPAREQFLQAARGRLAVEPPPPAWADTLGLKYSLPPDTAAFTGRGAELDRITAAVTNAAAGGVVVVVVAIHVIDGIPGVGKTALAVHAAHLLRTCFPDREPVTQPVSEMEGQRRLAYTRHSVDRVNGHDAAGAGRAAAGAGWAGHDGHHPVEFGPSAGEHRRGRGQRVPHPQRVAGGPGHHDQHLSPGFHLLATRGFQEPLARRAGQAECVSQQARGRPARRGMDPPFEIAECPHAQRRPPSQFLLGELRLIPQQLQQSSEIPSGFLRHYLPFPGRLRHLQIGGRPDIRQRAERPQHRGVALAELSDHHHAAMLASNVVVDQRFTEVWSGVELAGSVRVCWAERVSSPVGSPG